MTPTPTPQDPQAYVTPPGYGDTFYIYAFDGDGLTAGVPALNQRIPILDGDFIVRQFSGLDTMSSGIQIRDRLQNPYFGALFAQLGGFSSGVPVIPEKWYPEDGYIGFDLNTVTKKTIGVEGGVTTFASQICFFGVRRRKGVQSDPMASNYPGGKDWYSKPYALQFSLAITNAATVGGVLQGPTLQTVFVPDYDFMLMGIRAVNTSGTLEDPTPSFKILLYNGNKEQVSNIPIISQRLVTFAPGQAPERNYWPTPPILYRANSTIQFATSSLLLPPTVFPQNFDMQFIGVRRYPCR